MRNMLHRLFLMTMISSWSAFVYAVPVNNSILRLESKDLSREHEVYAVASKDDNDNKVYAMTKEALDDYGLEYALWIAEVSGNTFKLKNLGKEGYLNAEEVNSVVVLTLDNSGLSLKEDNTGYYRSQGFLGMQKGYIQYDPRYEEWRIYADDRTASNKNNSQGNGIWDDDRHPQSNEDTSMEIEGGDVENLFMDNGKLDIDAIKDVVASGNLDEVKSIYNADSKNIVVGTPTTYPAAGSSFWKTAEIELNVNNKDWTPVSFPVDVKCATTNLSGVGYREYSTENRAKGEPAWVGDYITSNMVFKRGVAYNFATDNATMTLKFEPVSAMGVTKVEKSYTQNLEGTTGSIETNQNWYYIGNALFVEAGLSAVDYACVYDRGNKKYVELNAANLSSLDPFATFFVQYAGSYTMSTSATRSSAPMLAREKSATEEYYLRIEGEGEEDQTGIFFEEEASAEGYVIGEDFLSFATIGGANTEIYTYAGDIDYSFNTRPIENTLVYVGLYIAKAGTYTISLDNISGNAETFVLYDNYEQDFVRLHLGETYTFYSERGEFNDRFGVAVTYAPEVPTDNISLSANKLIVVNNEIQGLTLDSELVVYDSTGRIVCAVNVDSETMILPNLNSGIYIARNGNGWVKFVVK